LFTRGFTSAGERVKSRNKASQEAYAKIQKMSDKDPNKRTLMSAWNEAEKRWNSTGGMLWAKVQTMLKEKKIWKDAEKDLKMVQSSGMKGYDDGMGVLPVVIAAIGAGILIIIKMLGEISKVADASVLAANSMKMNAETQRAEALATGTIVQFQGGQVAGITPTGNIVPAHSVDIILPPPKPEPGNSTGNPVILPNGEIAIPQLVTSEDVDVPQEVIATAPNGQPVPLGVSTNPDLAPIPSTTVPEVPAYQPKPQKPPRPQQAAVQPDEPISPPGGDIPPPGVWPSGGDIPPPGGDQPEPQKAGFSGPMLIFLALGIGAFFVFSKDPLGPATSVPSRGKGDRPPPRSPDRPPNRQPRASSFAPLMSSGTTASHQQKKKKVA
jgi:hypothetical protein